MWALTKAKQNFGEYLVQFCTPHTLPPLMHKLWLQSSLQPRCLWYRVLLKLLICIPMDTSQDLPARGAQIWLIWLFPGWPLRRSLTKPWFLCCPESFLALTGLWELLYTRDAQLSQFTLLRGSLITESTGDSHLQHRILHAWAPGWHGGRVVSSACPGEWGLAWCSAGRKLSSQSWLASSQLCLQTALVSISPTAPDTHAHPTVVAFFLTTTFPGWSFPQNSMILSGRHEFTSTNPSRHCPEALSLWSAIQSDGTH